MGDYVWVFLFGFYSGISVIAFFVGAYSAEDEWEGE
jgi:hypothetical protein